MEQRKRGHFDYSNEGHRNHFEGSREPHSHRLYGKEASHVLAISHSHLPRLFREIIARGWGVPPPWLPNSIMLNSTAESTKTYPFNPISEYNETLLLKHAEHLLDHEVGKL